MLYDKRWDAKVKADPLSLDNLIAWLEKKPSDKGYDYGCNGHCLFGQYLSQAYDGKANVGSNEFDIWKDDKWLIEDMNLPRGWGDLAWEHPRTFGGALDRARKLAARC